MWYTASYQTRTYRFRKSLCCTQLRAGKRAGQTSLYGCPVLRFAPGYSRSLVAAEETLGGLKCQSDLIRPFFCQSMEKTGLILGFFAFFLFPFIYFAACLVTGTLNVSCQDTHWEFRSHSCQICCKPDADNNSADGCSPLLDPLRCAGIERSGVPRPWSFQYFSTQKRSSPALGKTCPD